MRRLARCASARICLGVCDHTRGQSRKLLMSEACGTLAIGESAVWLQLTPLAQYLLALPLLGEQLSLAGFAGIVLGIAGIAWATARGHRPTPAARGI